MKIAHISDPHFSHHNFSWSLFKTKRWLGALNLFLFRQKRYQTTHLQDLPDFLKSLKPDHICITGDFSSLALDSEFAEAKEFTNKLHLPFFHMPGNHDAYTKQSEEEGTYYRYFPSSDLQRQRVERRPLAKGWWWIGLDCARANSLLYSNGCFYEQMERALDRELQAVPYGDRVIVGNHFPLYPAGRPHHDLERGPELLSLLQRYPQVKLYLHGHDHKPYIRQKRIPALNAGSCARTARGSFYILDISDSECLVTRYAYEPDHKPFHWVIDLEQTVSLS
jgi:3',5'-cyclic AMP phosphodiesterase CpdA